MLTVHHLNNSRSQRVLWLLEELNVPYEIVRYERDPKTMLAPKSLKGVHPLGKSPVVTDDGATVAETGAIIALWRRPVVTIARYSRASELHILDALRGRFGNATPSAQARF